MTSNFCARLKTVAPPLCLTDRLPRLCMPLTVPSTIVKLSSPAAKRDTQWYVLYWSSDVLTVASKQIHTYKQGYF